MTEGIDAELRKKVGQVLSSFLLLVRKVKVLKKRAEVGNLEEELKQFEQQESQREKVSPEDGTKNQLTKELESK